ncbi:MAG: DUF4126 domain-containing protein [Candidatus Eisenbacteria bacterium]|nr:DUF4126 domain-containing protein [Candidatus Eisenbacteria bacterium]
MEIALSVLVGIGLSAACGFRVFVPFLVASIAALSGHLSLSPGFEWIGTYYALVAFAVATLLEILAYYVPWLDNLLDTIATPVAVAAGVLISASVIADMSPFLRWTLAAVVGGGTAGIVQAVTVAVRGASSVTTGGLGNPVVSTGELGGSAVIATLAVVLPIVAVVLVIVIAGSLGGLRRWSRRRSSGVHV